MLPIVVMDSGPAPFGEAIQAVGWAKAQSAVPTTSQQLQKNVGTLRFAHPTRSPSVIASEAKQSRNLTAEAVWIASSQELLAMTVEGVPK